ncbi:MAG: 2-dehydro-3-deoxy-D-gluconate 5-dehydrogenase KduD [Phycisphaeraceae bacterium]|nr:MAG: 2-dehydro-3-deoxy-D-gluconate 5-dehydrogenase KduD [Phycisphaeraceae bacterium]
MILDAFKLDGKTALVTGAGRGLGQAMAIGLAQAGADVAVTDIGDMSETVAAIEKVGRKAVAITANLVDPQGHKPVVPAVIGAFGHLDILVNNAGIIRRAPIQEFTEKDWDDVMSINIRSVFMLSQAAAKHMIERGQGGKIVSVASMLSFQGGIRVPSYTASKSAVMGLTRLLACELAPHRICANAIAPGYMATENTRPLRDDAERSKAILERIPAGRWGEPTDLAGAVVFLSSRAADYVNGYTLAVDGGWLAR